MNKRSVISTVSPAALPTADTLRVSTPKLEISAVLEDEIVRGVLKPGQRLDERSLANRFGVSRTPIREALQRLSVNGLAETRARSGTFVKPVEISDVFLVFELMGELEALSAKFSAMRMTKAERVELRILAQHCEDSAGGSLDAYAASNIQFHDLIYRGTRNPFLEQQARSTRQRVAAYRRHTLNLPGRLESSVREHFLICDAIEAGDTRRSHELMLAHVDIKREDYAPFIAMISKLGT